MWWDGNKEKGTWIVKAFPQYALAVPKGDDHIWYRAAFQFELNTGAFYSGYWEMDIHFRFEHISLLFILVIIVEKYFQKRYASCIYYSHIFFFRNYRKALQPGQMPDPYVVKFFPETWDSKPHYWHFYEREELEQSTYDKGNNNTLDWPFS